MTAPRFQIRPHPTRAGVLTVTDGRQSEWTTAPASILQRLASTAPAEWELCDVVGFAERRARAFVLPSTHDRNLRPITQKELFTA